MESIDIIVKIKECNKINYRPNRVNTEQNNVDSYIVE